MGTTTLGEVIFLISLPATIILALILTEKFYDSRKLSNDLS